MSLFAEQVRLIWPGEIAAPVLLIWGECNPVLPPQMAYCLQSEVMPNADLRLIAQSGNCPVDETLDAFCATLHSWLDAVLIWRIPTGCCFGLQDCAVRKNLENRPDVPIRRDSPYTGLRTHR